MIKKHSTAVSQIVPVIPSYIYIYLCIYFSSSWSQSESYIDIVQPEHPWGILKTRSPVCPLPCLTHEAFLVSPQHHHSRWNIALPASHTASWIIWLPPHQQFHLELLGPSTQNSPSASSCSCVTCHAPAMSCRTCLLKHTGPKLLPYRKYFPYVRNIHPFSRLT